MSKALGVKNGEGRVSHPQPIRASGEHCESPHGFGAEPQPKLTFTKKAKVNTFYVNSLSNVDSLLNIMCVS